MKDETATGNNVRLNDELAVTLDAEVKAWRVRFPAYEFRAQDDCVALKLQKFGCHCDIEPGMTPDGCVIDAGTPDLCVIARRLAAEGKGRDDCHEWRPITFDR